LNSIASGVNTVSFGGNDPGNGQLITRRLTNISSAIADTDAVNLLQVKGAITAATFIAVEGAAGATPAIANGVSSLAVGADSAVQTGNFAAAFGTNANVSGNDSTALGSNTTVFGTNSVALGANSIALADNVVSIGNDRILPGGGPAPENFQRRLINLATGINDTDAVNVAQLNDAIATASLGGGGGVVAGTGVVVVAAGGHDEADGQDGAGQAHGSGLHGMGSSVIGTGCSGALRPGNAARRPPASRS